MSSKKVVFWLFFIVCWCNGRASDQMQLNIRPENVLNKNSKENIKSTYSLLSESISQAVKDDDSPESCVNDDISCLSTGQANDKLGLEAITALHRQLDDDANGNVDLSETNDFLREELQYDSGYERRQKAFHRNDDTHISVKELWEAWLRSEVHNWTVEQTTEWLAICVELPQYAHTFLRNKVTGAMLPR
ncbi:stromal interaction molecule homolog [Agrilus planipennis]|uniref:Stromal interaction molecule homolog n=1 Tax=Agrilus planipennis TaxID=224129 RepID=A0A7F5RLW6_AGRPL|nr:stromal interaction molecule homolog [Agrilus planipennis]